MLLRRLCAMAGLLTLAGAVQAAPLVSPQTLPETENAVFTRDGRYFVAGAAGIHEVKTAADASPNCSRDAVRNLTVCRLVAPVLDGQPCFFSGMTTNGSELYAACTVMTADGPSKPPVAAAFYRVRPGAGASASAQVSYRHFPRPIWYNGMAVAPDGAILLSNSASGSLQNGPGAAVDRLVITDPTSLAFTLKAWLPASIAYLMPNGLVVDGGYVYFVSGTSLLRIAYRADGRAGMPVPIYHVWGAQLLDDLVVRGDRVVVSEIALVNGTAVNDLVSVPKTGFGPVRRVFTGLVQTSSLAVDPGRFGPAGGLIATSYFQGGLYSYPAP